VVVGQLAVRVGNVSGELRVVLLVGEGAESRSDQLTGVVDIDHLEVTRHQASRKSARATARDAREDGVKGEEAGLGALAAGFHLGGHIDGLRLGLVAADVGTVVANVLEWAGLGVGLAQHSVMDLEASLVQAEDVRADQLLRLAIEGALELIILANGSVG